MDEWLTQAGDALADASGLPREDLELSGPQMKTLLDLAALAAHSSGVRVNAPLLCYLVGRAQAGGADLATLADAVRRSSS